MRLPERNGQAITATIKSSNIKIDLVPAGPFTHVTTGKTFYNIPKGNKTDEWILTAPEDDMESLDEVAKDKTISKNYPDLQKNKGHIQFSGQLFRHRNGHRPVWQMQLLAERPLFGIFTGH